MRISGPRILLIFDSVGVRQQMLRSDILSRWFSRVVEWNEADCVLDCRRVWLSVFGVPVHAQSRDNFEHLVSHWGSLVLVDEATLEPSSFEWGRMLVETHVLDRI
ncbi:hypothetical protein V6N13_053709 [Hibiscus sabdariffa]|uniref:Uncharacterized protein n=2 Tax=Hibiscus sabdariffa TaxID=183260 RepID=A0ABR2T6T0_9ROSI